jgi:hypothetical protein
MVFALNLNKKAQSIAKGPRAVLTYAQSYAHKKLLLGGEALYTKTYLVKNTSQALAPVVG